MKGEIQPNHIAVNKYELLVLGAPTLVFTEISGMDSETPTVDLPDRTTASGGEELPGEFTAMMPMHHTVQILFMDLWLQEGRDPVSPFYKKVATMLWKSIDNQVAKTYQALGLFVSKRSTPDAEKGNDGDLALVEYTFKYDSLQPI